MNGDEVHSRARAVVSVLSGGKERPLPLDDGFVPTLGVRPLAERIAIASDHAAIEMKTALTEYLRAAGHEVLDLGPDGADPVDYPDYGYRLAAVIASGEAGKGVAICGSGIGISIAVNRNPAARAALVSEPLSARLAREHNDANVIAMGARLIGVAMAKECLDAFLATPFGGDRHLRRVEKLSNPVFAKEPA